MSQMFDLSRLPFLEHAMQTAADNAAAAKLMLNRVRAGLMPELAPTTVEQEQARFDAALAQLVACLEEYRTLYEIKYGRSLASDFIAGWTDPITADESIDWPEDEEDDEDD